MNNNKNVLNRNYVSLEKFNKIKYDLYLKDNEIEYKTQCQNDIIQQQRAVIKQLLDERKYWYDECQKLSNNQNVNEQYKQALKNINQIRSELINDIKEDKDKLEQNKNKEIQNKDNEIKDQKEENNKLKDNIIQNKNKEIERLEGEKEELREENDKIRNEIIQIIDYYIDGKDIKEIILNLLRVLKVNNKDGE